VSNLEVDPVETSCGSDAAVGARLDWLDGREVALGRYTVVRRLLPHTNRRMVGAWCFFDHFGPDAVYNTPGMLVPPHPHCGLQTVTWLFEGAVRHSDSLGTRADIEPGQLNLMTAGRGIAHAEISPPDRPPTLHGLQLWIALPLGAAEGGAHFEHHGDLPQLALPDGVRATVVIGDFGGVASPARVHTPLVGVEIALALGGQAELPLRPDFEYAFVCASGTAVVAGRELAPGALLYLGTGRSSVAVAADTDARLFLIGGEPFDEELVMWWNFVARSHEEIVQARADWESGTRFGTVTDYDGDPLPAPEMPSVRLKPRGREGRPLT
jgi:quercetin 2,3-dioxygenase